MYRKQLNQLSNWVHKANRKPLILSGARQVGKSTLVRLFAQQHNCALVEINLERNLDLSSVFKSNNPADIINTLEALPNIGSISPKSLLFLDEIQAVPEAVPALRYFYEDMGALALVSAGSLLEFVLNDHTFSMPVGRIEYLHMGPMTFTEFLDALDENKLSSLIKNFNIGDTFNPVVHSRLLGLLRRYYFVGGMPEAVKVYAESRQLKRVSEVHNAVIETYRDDFPKYIGSRKLSRIQQVFNFAARNIGKKVKYSQFSNQEKSATIKKDIELLCMARLLSKVIHCHCSGLPLQADIEENIYKLIFLDIGLMNAICGLGWQNISQLSGTPLINEGAIAEQFIGQHLQDILSDSPNRELTYWLREGKSSNAEVDYVLALNGSIVPIEVKAGATGSLKSLHQFVAEKRVPLALRFDASPPSIHTITSKTRSKEKIIDVNYQLYSLPLYLVERLPELELSGLAVT
jgi:predicted AAA+ superfamily ATPase